MGLKKMTTIIKVSFMKIKVGINFHESPKASASQSR